MYKLIIWCKYDSWAKMKPDEVELDQEYNEAQAELRALRWLLYRPNDLVMLVPA
jgi:hypothetical protein